MEDRKVETQGKCIQSRREWRRKVHLYWLDELMRGRCRGRRMGGAARALTSSKQPAQSHTHEPARAAKQREKKQRENRDKSFRGGRI